MATLTELQDRLDKLREYRARPSREVEFEGSRVAYKSDDEIAAAIADLTGQIASMTTTPITTVLVAGSKGLDSA